MADSLSDDLGQLCRMFEESEEGTREARQKAERDRDYFDLKQWTATETAALQLRKQPVITFDRTKRKVMAIMGIEKQTRKDPKAFPRNPQDEGAAQAATDAIRFVCDDCRWDDKRSLASENLIVEGTGAIKVGVKKTRAGIDPEITRVPWDRLFYDPHSCEFDFADASYMGEVIWMNVDDAKRLFPGKDEVLDGTLAFDQGAETYDDRPKFKLWADTARKRVRIVEIYYKRGGQWAFSIFTKGGYLVDPQPSPYLDDEGQPENPIKAVSLYIDRDNNRYGDVRSMIGPQDEINKRRSKALHLISVRQFRVSPAALQSDIKQFRDELARPDGGIVADAGDFEILHNGDQASANLQLLQEAKNEIDLQGVNAALAGKNEQDMSGRAIIAQQQAGMVEAATFLDRVKVLSMAVYRAVWCRIRQHWNAERWIRVTDNEQNLRFVGLNRPVTMLEAQAEQMGVTKDNIGQAPPEVQQRLTMLASHPMAQQVARIDNAVADLDVDIVVDEGIDAPTVAAEQFEQMMKLAGTGIVQIPPDVMIEASSLRNKDKLLEMLKQPPSPEAQAAKELQLKGAAAGVAKTEAEAVLTGAKAQNEQMKPFIEAAKAQQPQQPVAA